MSVFGTYARYYDALYAAKEYATECDFIDAAFARFSRRPGTILDLACGTGNHGLILQERGYEVCGVDRSAAMLNEYRRKAGARGLNAELILQDAVDLSLGRRFDAAVWMFDAICYLTENEQLQACLGRLREHLVPGGLVIFDFWHAAPLLRGHERVRIREAEMDDRRILRISSTSLDHRRQTAEVAFRVVVFEGDRTLEDFTEVHRMRYFLPREMEYILTSVGWDLVHLCPAFNLDRELNGETWHLAAIATPSN